MQTRTCLCILHMLLADSQVNAVKREEKNQCDKVWWVRWRRPADGEGVLVGALGGTARKRVTFASRVLKNEKGTHLWVEGLISDKSGRGGKVSGKYRTLEGHGQWASALVWPELMGTGRGPHCRLNIWNLWSIAQLPEFLVLSMVESHC